MYLGASFDLLSESDWIRESNKSWTKRTPLLHRGRGGGVPQPTLTPPGVGGTHGDACGRTEKVLPSTLASSTRPKLSFREPVGQCWHSARDAMGCSARQNQGWATPYTTEVFLSREEITPTGGNNTKESLPPQVRVSGILPAVLSPISSFQSFC